VVASSVAFERNPWREFIAGGRGRPPRFLYVLLVTLAFGCVADSVATLRPLAARLRLDPAIWEGAELWRLVTYGLVGHGGIGPWTLLQLVLVYWLGMEMCVWMRARRAQTILIGGIAISGAVAAACQFASDVVGGPRCDADPFWLLQGQNVVVAVGIAAFAARNRHSTVSHTPYLLGLPLPTRWLVPIQLLIAAGGALSTHDLGGFAGIVTATAWGWSASTRRWGPRGPGSVRAEAGP
jgi:hypothetical protein